MRSNKYFVTIDNFFSGAYLLSLMTENCGKMKSYKLAPVAAMLTTYGHLALAQTAATDALPINVSNVRNGEGAVVIARFDVTAAFGAMDVTKVVALAYVPASSASVSVTFQSLPPGNYAAVAMHDENLDGDLNMNGAPLHRGLCLCGYGAKRPCLKFEDAAVQAGDEATSALKLVYWN
ncbi:MAG: hypothetical protein CSA85_00035 [Alphaproteobacteria bacterium]|nr:MAG: hypothetical protein CSA85_00035 [Alphaproteobacteria bacterium]